VEPEVGYVFVAKIAFGQVDLDSVLNRPLAKEVESFQVLKVPVGVKQQIIDEDNNIGQPMDYGLCEALKAGGVVTHWYCPCMGMVKAV